MHEKTLLSRLDYGEIFGYLRSDGYWWISEFTIFPEFRGKGLAKMLANHLPKKCKLLAYPLFNAPGPHITVQALVKFYTSIGFVQIADEIGNQIMIRG